MDIYELLFIVALAGCTAIIINKLYNVYEYFLNNQIQSLFSSLLLFVGYSLFWFFAYLVLIENPESILYMMIFNLLSWVMGVNFILTAIELFCCMGWAAQKVYTEPYQASKERGIVRR
jgi:cytosine/uracil/thiamine/allantoin permease